jgi:hypothetical protein
MKSVKWYYEICFLSVPSRKEINWKRGVPMEKWIHLPKELSHFEKVVIHSGKARFMLCQV